MKHTRATVWCGLTSLFLAGLVGPTAAARAAPPGPAEPSDAPRNAISLEPLSVVFARTIALEYERGIGRFGLHAGVALTLGDVSIGGDSPSSGDYLALAFTLGARFYPWSEAPAGAFIGPFGSVAWVDAEATTSAGSVGAGGVGWAAGAMVGWTWILGSSFELSLGLGAAYYQLSIDPDGQGEASAKGRDGVLPALRLAVGAAF